MAKKPEKPSDTTPEEVSLGSPSAPAPDGDVKFAPKSVSGLEQLAKSGATNEDLVDQIIQIPEEQLIPWEECTLPSQGLYYGWTTGVIQARAWGANVDKILATARLAQSGQSIDMMIGQCCKFPDGFDPTQLLVGDQVFLLYYLRGITHGNIYEFATNCPQPDCQTTGTFVADLNELASTITPADPSLGQEPFKVELPYMSEYVGRDVWVSVRYMRVADSQFIVRQRRATNRAVGKGGRARVRRRQPPVPQQQEEKMPAGQRKIIEVDDTLMQNLETMVADVMGVSDRFKVRSFVNKLHSTDLAVIREWLRDHSPGIDTQVEISCTECGNDFRVMLPITEAFFRPQNDRRLRE